MSEAMEAWCEGVEVEELEPLECDVCSDVNARRAVAIVRVTVWLDSGSGATVERRVCHSHKEPTVKALQRLCNRTMEDGDG